VRNHLAHYIDKQRQINGIEPSPEAVAALELLDLQLEATQTVIPKALTDAEMDAENERYRAKILSDMEN
jgi:hypothetical protein